MKNLFFLLVFFPLVLFAQENAKLAGKSEGTYQIEFLRSAKEPIAVTGEILQKIEANRKETEVAYLLVNPQCRIKIFPKNTLSAPKAAPVEEYVIVEKFDN